MEPARILFKDMLERLPPEWLDDPLPEIRSLFQEARKKIVILDDDPTGNQTVFNIPVLTQWPVDALRSELDNDLPAFFILTNSRSLPTPQAQTIGFEIGNNLAEASRLSGRSIAVVSRGDSTLRGHFPEEVDSLVDGLKMDFDAWLLIPALIGAGRYTIENVHYAQEGEWLVPVGQTVYAQDGTFGYHASDLRKWVAEKSKGRISDEAIATISLNDIRLGGPERVFEILMNLRHGCVVIMNAASRRDFEVLVKGILLAEAQKRRYIYRTTATFIPARFGLGLYQLLQREDLNLSDTGGGLLIIGSYVPKTTRQIEGLFEREPVTRLEVSVSNLLNANKRLAEIKKIASQADRSMQRNQDTVIFTSRELVYTDDPERNLVIGQHISSGLIDILEHIQVRPRYLLAKGGITSHDVATKAMGVKRAMVIGQICQGVSIWRMGQETRYPDLAYIVFPGNVGAAETLADVVRKLRNS